MDNKIKTMEVKIKKLHKDAVIPQRATKLSGCWDVVTTEIIQESNDFVICKLGFALELPQNMELVLVPRSGFTKTKWILQNSPGQGDPDYTGEYQYRFRAIPVGLDYFDYFIYPEFPYKVGDRIGQIYLREIIPIKFEEVEELSQTERGEGGFGSTGN